MLDYKKMLIAVLDAWLRDESQCWNHSDDGLSEEELQELDILANERTERYYGRI